MNSEINHIINSILQNPVTWIDTESKIAYNGFLSHTCIGLVNSWIAKQHNLEKVAPDIEITQVEKMIFQNWENLLNILNCMAAQRHRATLFQKQRNKLPNYLHSFMQLDLDVKKFPNYRYSLTTGLQELSYYEALSLKNHISAFTMNMVQLRFPKKLRAVQTPAPDFCIKLFYLAHQHVKKNQSILP